MDLDILYEDNHIIAVNKRAGQLVQGDKTKDEPLPEKVKKYLKRKYNKPGDVYLGVVHRLDRPVSGLVLFGRTSKATSRLNDAFRNNKIEKNYVAIVIKDPPKEFDTLKAPLLKNAKLNKSYIPAKGTNKGKLSELSYRWLASYENLHLLDIMPVTGRHHQIRVMLSSIGCIIKGDLKYGARKSNADGNICLHAHSIKFIHPVRKDVMTIKAPLPNTADWEVFKDNL